MDAPVRPERAIMRADHEMRFRCLELAMKSSTYKIDSALETAERLVKFVEQEPPAPAKEHGTTRPKRAPKAAGKTADGDTKVQD